MPDVPRIGPSVAKVLIQKSPMHAKDAYDRRLNNESESTDAMIAGQVFDQLLFGTGLGLVIIDAPDFRTKAAKEERDYAISIGRIPVLQCKLEPYAAAIQKWEAQFMLRGISLEGESQVEIDWDHMGVACRGHLDHLIIHPNCATIWDLKTCQDASPRAVESSIARYGYDIQHAAYVEAVETDNPHLAGAVKMAFLFCEVNPPYAVNIVELSGAYRELGQCKWNRAVATWGKCVKSGVFPGYGATVCEPRSYQMEDLETGGDDADSDA